MTLSKTGTRPLALQSKCIDHTSPSFDLRTSSRTVRARTGVRERFPKPKFAIQKLTLGARNLSGEWGRCGEFFFDSSNDHVKTE